MEKPVRNRVKPVTRSGSRNDLSWTETGRQKTPKGSEEQVTYEVPCCDQADLSIGKG